MKLQQIYVIAGLQQVTDQAIFKNKIESNVPPAIVLLFSQFSPNDQFPIKYCDANMGQMSR